MISLEEREEIILLLETYGNLLTQTQKQALHLHFVEDLSLAEIGAILAVSRQAVHDAINKAKKKLLSIQDKVNAE